MINDDDAQHYIVPPTETPIERDEGFLQAITQPMRRATEFIALRCDSHSMRCFNGSLL